MWSRTSAAAVIAPIRQGHRLTRRRALNVVLSSEFPRSATARVAQCSMLTVRSVGRLRGLLDRTGEPVGLVEVAQVGQYHVLRVAPLDQRVERDGVGAENSAARKGRITR